MQCLTLVTMPTNQRSSPMASLVRPIRIQTARCVLKEMRLADTPYWFAFMNNPRIKEFLPDSIGTHAEMEGIVEWLIRNYSADISEIVRITLAIHLRSDESRPIGWVTYGPLPEAGQFREIGFAIEPEQWRKGYATEAATEFLKWIWRAMPSQEIYATVHLQNVASMRVLTRIGMSEYDSTGNPELKPSRNHRVYKLSTWPAGRECSQ